ncbi:hypothetical protein H6764_01450 [Candidatus Nomurabacteria bacterium]|nr:hypothetical protein [Candidatus Nomurabacteria bacterium]
MKKSQKKLLSKVLNIYVGIGVIFWIAAGILILTPILPSVLYNIFPHLYQNEIKSLTGDLDKDQKTFADIRAKYINDDKDTSDELPPFDPSLPKTNSIKISSIGVDAELQQGSDWESALKKGPWVVEDFGRPDTTDSPTIIASHRWGTLFWDSEQRKKISFLKLPDTKIGDKIEIIWGQRKYEYEIYAGEENTEITDYNADLILYTCKLYWESPVRIFRYAKR